MTVETCLLLIMGWFCNFIVALFLEQLCSCYYPFLLSARYYVTIKNSSLRAILIAPMLTRSTDTKTAAEDQDKLPFCGFIYCIVIFPWLFCEIAILLAALILVVLKSDFIYSPFMSDLIDVCEWLFTSKYYWLVIVAMPIVHRLDYEIGSKRHSK